MVAVWMFVLRVIIGILGLGLVQFVVLLLGLIVIIVHRSLHALLVMLVLCYLIVPVLITFHQGT